jgi:HEXXH motif-containing protein
VNAADLLWNDKTLYRARYEKTAAALIAISKALERNHPLGGNEAEFLELYQRMAAADPDAFTEVWHDPTAYFWVRLAYEFVGTCLTPAPISALADKVARARGATDAKSALQGHLEDFKRFVLSLGRVAGADQRFRTPLEVALPFALPASRLVIHGEGTLLVHALVDGHLEVSHAGHQIRLALRPTSIDSLTVRDAPVAVVNDYSLRLQPEAFNLAGLEEGEVLQTLPSTFQSQHLELTTQALQLLQRHSPETFRHFRDLIRLIALKSDEVGDYSNISHSDLPGSFVVTVTNDAYLMADFFTHEFYHNRFFFVEEPGPFFAQQEDNLVQRSEYYSPFREDLRPLHGIFHGLYVYLAVWRFWHAVWQSGETSGLRAAAVVEQLAAVATRLAITVAQLRRFARLSARGRKLFEALADESARIQQTTRALNLPAELPAIACDADGVFSIRREEGSGQPLTVRRMIQGHVGQYDRHRQCLDSDAIITATLGSER